MKVIIGLGNYSKKYLYTRHNVGFSVVDSFAESKHVPFSGTSFHCQAAQMHNLSKEKVLLIKPTTMMNLSGICVQSLARFYHLSCADFLIIQDDLDLPFGQYKIKANCSHSGHNGIKDIMEKMQSKNFWRIKIGIGRPQNKQPIVDYVLGQFSLQEQQKLMEIREELKIFLELWMNFSPNIALNKFSIWKQQNKQQEGKENDKY